MNDKRQKIQLKLAFAEDAKGEARSAFVEGTESFKAERKTESPAIVERLMGRSLRARKLRAGTETSSVE